MSRVAWLALHNEVIQLYDMGYGRRLIANRLKMPYTTISKWIRERKDVRTWQNIYWTNGEIEFLRNNYHKLSLPEMAHLLGRSLRSVKIKASRMGIVGKRSFASIPETVSSPLAYILGVLCGDGTCGKDVKLEDTDHDFVGAFARALEVTFKRNIRIRTRKNKVVRFAGKPEWKGTQYCAGTEQKEVVSYIKSLGSYRARGWKIPECVLTGSSDLKAAFIRGLFDSEGCVHRYRKGGRTYISLDCGTVNPETHKVKDLLGQLGIRAFNLCDDKNGMYRVSVHDLLSVVRFASRIGVTSERKFQLLHQNLRFPKSGSHAREARTVDPRILGPPSDKFWFLGPNAIATESTVPVSSTV